MLSYARRLARGELAIAKVEIIRHEIRIYVPDGTLLAIETTLGESSTHVHPPIDVSTVSMVSRLDARCTQ